MESAVTHIRSKLSPAPILKHNAGGCGDCGWFKRMHVPGAESDMELNTVALDLAS